MAFFYLRLCGQGAGARGDDGSSEPLLCRILWENMKKRAKVCFKKCQNIWKIQSNKEERPAMTYSINSLVHFPSWFLDREEELRGGRIGLSLTYSQASSILSYVGVRSEIKWKLVSVASTMPSFNACHSYPHVLKFLCQCSLMALQYSSKRELFPNSRKQAPSTEHELVQAVL